MLLGVQTLGSQVNARSAWHRATYFSTPCGVGIAHSSNISYLISPVTTDVELLLRLMIKIITMILIAAI